MRIVWWLDLARDEKTEERLLEPGELAGNDVYTDDVNVIFDYVTMTAYTVVIDETEAACNVVLDTLEQYKKGEL